MSRQSEMLECEAMLLTICKRSYDTYLQSPVSPNPPAGLVKSLSECHKMLAAGLARDGAQADMPLEQVMVELEMAKDNVRKQLELQRIAARAAHN